MISVGDLQYFRLIASIVYAEGKGGLFKLDKPDHDQEYHEIEHLPSGRWVRIFDQGDVTQVMHFESEDDEFGRWMTVTDYRAATGKVLAYLENHISFEEE